MIRNKASKLLILTGAIIIALIFLVWQINWFVSWQKSEYVFEGIKIYNIDLGGYDVVSAQNVLAQNIKKELETMVIELKFEDYDITQSVIAYDFASYDFLGKVHEAYSIGRTGNLLLDFFTMFSSKFFGNELKLTPTIDKQKLAFLLTQLSDVYYVAPQNAYIVSFDPNAPSGSRLNIVNEVLGYELDIEKTSQSIEKAILNRKVSADCYVSEVYANITNELLQSIDSSPIISEYTIKDITAENESSILQIVGLGRHKVLIPGEKLSIIEFLGGEDYIYLSMPDGGTKSDFEQALTKHIPTQIYIASVMSEIDIITRHAGNINQSDLPTGTETIINQYSDMTIKNNLDLPIIIRVGYKNQNIASQIFCEVYRAPMENAALLRSIIKKDETTTSIDILRVYIDEKGNPIESIIIETINEDNTTNDG